MLVVDRRDDQGAYAPGQNRAQVQAELERHHFKHAGAYESTAVPAPVEVERPPPGHEHPSHDARKLIQGLEKGPEIGRNANTGAVSESATAPAPASASVSESSQTGHVTDLGARDGVAAEGVPCVTETPGSAALVRLLLERVWGVDVAQADGVSVSVRA